MAGIRIPFLSDVAAFLKGTSDIESALDDVLDGLDAVGDRGERAGADVAAALGRAGDQAIDAARTLERGYDDALAGVARNAQTAAEDIDQQLTSGFDDAAAAAADFADDAGRNTSGLVDRFKASVGELPGVTGDALGAIETDFGTLGELLAAGPAKAVEVTVELLKNLADNINQAKQEVADLAAEIIETGEGLAGIDLTARIREWGLEIRDVRSWWEVWQTDAVTNIERVTAAAETAGEPIGDLWAAMSDPSLDEARAQLEYYRSEMDRLAESYETSAAAGYGHTGAITDEQRALMETSAAYGVLAGDLEDFIREHDAAASLAREMTAAEHGVSTAVVESAEAMQAATAAQAELASARADALDITRSAYGAETAYAETLDKTRLALAENGATLDITTTAGRANRDALLDLSGAALDNAEAMAAAGASTSEVSAALEVARADFIASAEAAGLNAAQARALADELMGVPGRVATDVTTTAKAAQSEVGDYIREVQGIPTARTTTIRTEVSGIEEARARLLGLVSGLTVPVTPVVARAGKRAPL